MTFAELGSMRAVVPRVHRAAIVLAMLSGACANGANVPGGSAGQGAVGGVSGGVAGVGGEAGTGGIGGVTGGTDMAGTGGMGDAATGGTGGTGDAGTGGTGDAGTGGVGGTGDAGTGGIGGAGTGGVAGNAHDGGVDASDGPDASGVGVCGGATPHGCYVAKPDNPMGCPPQIHEQSAPYPPAAEWVACSSPNYVPCYYTRPSGGDANCSCDLGLHWLCTY